MSTSVPQVLPLGEVMRRLGVTMEKSLLIYKMSGDIEALELTTELTREVYEQQMKLAANTGRMKWDRVNQIRDSLERAEAFVQKRKAPAP